MTFLWIIDCIAIGLAVALVCTGCWLAICLILLAVHSVFRHNFEAVSYTHLTLPTNREV